MSARVRVALWFAISLCLSLAACGRKNRPRVPTTGSPTGPVATTPTPDLSGKKVVMIIASDQYRDEELTKPKAMLEKAGAQVTVACSSLDEAKGMLGGRAKPDVLLSDVSCDDYDAVVFVGGSGASEYWDDSTAHNLAKAAAAQDKVLGAICLAPVTLARAGLLKGKRATVWKSERGQLSTAGAECVDQPVVTDGKIITGDGPAAAEEFGKALMRALAE